MRRDIAIYGAGGSGREVACTIQRINEAEADDAGRWNIIGFFDDGVPAGTTVSHFGRCLGGMEVLNAYGRRLSVAVAICNSQTVRKIVGGIHNPNVEFPNIIHPKIIFMDAMTFHIGQGNIIQSNCVMSCNVSIGNFNVLNGADTFGHDMVVGNFNTIMPAVRVSGAVHIGDENFFGVGSIILQQLTIGNRVKLGAGSVLMTKPKDDSLYMGNPAKLFRY